MIACRLRCLHAARRAPAPYAWNQSEAECRTYHDAGCVFSLVVGIRLMALVFYSSRKGYDEPPTFLD